MKKVMAFYALAAVWALLIALPWSTPAQKSTVTNQVTAVASDASMVPITAKGAASQTGDLYRGRNSSNVDLYRVDKDGNLLLFPATTSGDLNSPYIQLNGYLSSVAKSATIKLAAPNGDGLSSLYLAGPGANGRLEVLQSGTIEIYSDNETTGIIDLKGGLKNAFQGYLHSTQAVAAKSFADTVNTYTSNQTLTKINGLVQGDATGGNVTFTLPLANALGGFSQTIVVTKSDPGVNLVKVQRQGSDTIQGATATVDISNQWGAVTFKSDGVSNWIITAVM